MYTANVEIFSDESNAAVLRHHGRKFPGVLIQGDTLHSLARMAPDALDLLKAGDPEAVDEISDLAARLDGLVIHYETVLLAHGHELPFAR